MGKPFRAGSGQPPANNRSRPYQGKWLRYPSFYWQVVPEKLDSYISYRLIEPGYEVWNKIQLCEREINSFEERIIADNKDTDGSCMNCRIYGNKKGSLSMFITGKARRHPAEP